MTPPFYKDVGVHVCAPARVKLARQRRQTLWKKDKDEAGRIFLLQRVRLKFKDQNEQTGLAVLAPVRRF